MEQRKKLTKFKRMNSNKFKSNFSKPKKAKGSKEWWKFWRYFKGLSLEEKQQVIISLMILALKV